MFPLQSNDADKDAPDLTRGSDQEVKVEGPREVDSKVEDLGFESSFIVIQCTMQEANATSKSISPVC
ncbi:unnamed protein product [Clonostachys chloroleuca]|uniref:Uncharacterized protein n=1 Tax=Clonostachys chloroleuca TaxID=1926264 RepID=A0AA35LW65_9HYPO|nr:unnamed protein product [Clonostachys chloroleuca]